MVCRNNSESLWISNVCNCQAECPRWKKLKAKVGQKQFNKLVIRINNDEWHQHVDAGQVDELGLHHHLQCQGNLHHQHWQANTFAANDHWVNEFTHWIHHNCGDNRHWQLWHFGEHQCFTKQHTEQLDWPCFKINRGLDCKFNLKSPWIWKNWLHQLSARKANAVHQISKRCPPRQIFARLLQEFSNGAQCLQEPRFSSCQVWIFQLWCK